jgi:cell division protein FtsL
MKNNKNRTKAMPRPKKKRVVKKGFARITKHKKKLYMIIVGLVILSGVGVAVFLSSSNINNQTPDTSKTSGADALKLQAIKLMHSDSKKAKNLLEQALVKYQLAKDINNIVDVKSQLYLIDHNKN